nr:increased DNA methylation 1-like [Tanacetum cinerariifolium]
MLDGTRIGMDSFLKIFGLINVDVSLSIMVKCFVPMVDTRTCIHMILHCRSEYVGLNYEGFYTMVLEKDDILPCVASLRTGYKELGVEKSGSNPEGEREVLHQDEWMQILAPRLPGKTGV